MESKNNVNVPRVMSEKLTRPWTVLGACSRLMEIGFPISCKTTLVVHIVGADYKEGESGKDTLLIFDEFLTHARDMWKELKSVWLVCIGPNVNLSMHEKQVTENVQGLQVTAAYYSDTWEIYAGSNSYRRGHIAFCFNAGVWGYDNWLPSIDLILAHAKIPVVVTSYNEQEAGDDEDCLEELGYEWCWRPESNPYGSSTIRQSKSYVHRTLVDNGFWQCLSPMKITAP